MDKQQEAQADSLSTVTVKEYTPSEGFGSEPPPAYQKLRSSSVQIARLAAITIVVSSFVLGSFILASAWIQANASCRQDLYDQPEHLLQPQALTQDAADLSEEPSNHVDEPLPTDDSPEQHQQHSEEPPASPSSLADLLEDAQTPVRVRLPLQLDFDDIAGMLVQKNQRSRMNCVVEKKRAEEIVDHQPRTLRLPFGVNVTTDPRYEHVSGEKMAISCESGSDQRHAPMETMPQGPVVIPLPGPVHLPLQFHGAMQQRLRAQQLHELRAQQARALLMQQQQQQHQQQQHFQGVPPPGFQMQQLHFPMVLPVPLQTTVHVADQPRESPRQHQVQFPAHEQQQQQHEQEAVRRMPPHVLQQIQEARQGRGLPPVEVVELREAPAFPQPIEVMEVHAQPEGPGPRAFQRLPMHVPVPMTHHQPPERAEEPRPHYVQPRSVRSVDDVLRREKRMRRCACDCAC